MRHHVLGSRENSTKIEMTLFCSAAFSFWKIRLLRENFPSRNYSSALYGMCSDLPFPYLFFFFFSQIIANQIKLKSLCFQYFYFIMKRSLWNYFYSVLCHLLSQKSLNNVIYSLKKKKPKQNKRDASALTCLLLENRTDFRLVCERKHFERFWTRFTTHTAHSCQNWPVKYLHRLSTRE